MKKAFSTKLVVILLFLTLACLGGAVFAGSEKHESKEKEGDHLALEKHGSEEKEGDHMVQVFSYKDKNQDGVITKEEWPYSEDYFKKIDTDGDGNVSLDEFKGKEKGEHKVYSKGEKTLLFKDKDKNGLIVQEEWKGTPEEFQSFDADQNGSLSKEECKAALELGKDFHHGCISKYFNKKLCGMDADKNGSLSLAEWKCRPKEFEKLDKDQNKSISEEELKACCQLSKGFKSFHKMECHKAGKMKGDSAKANLKDIFSHKDKNQDGIISAEEWPGCPKAFKTMDKNGDGGLSSEEFESKHQFKKMDSKAPGGCPKAAGEKKEKEPVAE